MYQNNLSIRSWAEEDQPREKLKHRGRSALSTAELLAILIRTGGNNRSAVQVAQELMASCHQNLNALAKLSSEELTEISGIGPVKATTILAAMELGRRRRAEERIHLPEINSSRMGYEFILPFLEDLPHEEFWVVYLNKKNRVLKRESISKGGISETVVDNKIIFSSALKVLASSIILFHNHPSGSPKPSQADHVVTKRIVSGAKLLDIKVLDHLIIGDQCYYSFADEGNL